MASYVSTQSGNFSDPNTWGGAGYPHLAGDTFTVSVGHTVTVDISLAGINLGASTVNGTLQWATGANTALQHNGTITGNNGAIVGQAAAVGAGYTAQLIWGGADGGKLLWIKDGCQFLPLGHYDWNMQSEAWASCYTTLQAQAASGQPDISVPAAFANALQASGDVLLIQGTTGYTQSEIVTVLSKSGGTITLTGNLANTHASGAYVCLLSRNFIVKGSSASNRFVIDNDNTVAGNCDCKLTFFENVYELQGSTTVQTWDFDFCAFKCRYGLTTLAAKATNTIFAGENTSARLINNGYNLTLQHVVFGHGTYGIFNYWAGRCEDLTFFGLTYGLAALDTITLSGAEFLNNYYAVYLVAYNEITDGTFSGNTIDVYVQGGQLVARYCDLAVVSLTSTRGFTTWVCSQDHGRVLGAAKTWIGQVGTIERQNSVARSGYAAEVTTGPQCSSDEPLEIPFDIPCTHGDVITASIYVRVNSTYGTDHDPTLVLDPDGIYGCADTSTEDVTAADTWTQLTVTGTANLGGAGVKGVVNCVLRIPYYVAGGKVYVDDFEVTIA
ncbi:MAG: hypothetical protein AB1696_25155 [Planctomycetota bacterium]